MASVLRLAGWVSVYCDWVRQQAWSVTSYSVWQHTLLSMQIHPTYPLHIAGMLRKKGIKKKKIKPFTHKNKQQKQNSNISEVANMLLLLLTPRLTTVELWCKGPLICKNSDDQQKLLQSTRNIHARRESVSNLRTHGRVVITIVW